MGKTEMAVLQEQVLDELTRLRHQQACQAGEASYIDPKTGYHVMTEFFLRQRGYCCQSGCRHCPYGFALDLQ